jgi:hypothetical protein
MQSEKLVVFLKNVSSAYVMQEVAEKCSSMLYSVWRHAMMDEIIAELDRRVKNLMEYVIVVKAFEVMA